MNWDKTDEIRSCDRLFRGQRLENDDMERPKKLLFGQNPAASILSCIVELNGLNVNLTYIQTGFFLFLFT